MTLGTFIKIYLFYMEYVITIQSSKETKKFIILKNLTIEYKKILAVTKMLFINFLSTILFSLLYNIKEKNFMYITEKIAKQYINPIVFFRKIY